MVAPPDNRIFVSVRWRHALILYIAFALISLYGIGTAIHDTNWPRLLGFLLLLILTLIGFRTLYSSKFCYTDEQEFKVEKERNTIKVLRNGRTAHVVDLGELQAIWIKTTDEGPYSEDVYWVLSVDGHPDIFFPSSALSDDETLHALIKLPEFDYETFVLAMASSERKLFQVWAKTT